MNILNKKNMIMTYTKFIEAIKFPQTLKRW